MKPWLKTSLVLPFLVILLGANTPGVSTSCPPGGRRQTGAQNGEYELRALGHYAGTGKADVDATEVSLRIYLKGDNGVLERLEVNDLDVEGPYFSGNGTLGSKTVQIFGRLDAAKASRFTATFRVSDGHVGRLVGTLPADTGNPNWQIGDN